MLFRNNSAILNNILRALPSFEVDYINIFKLNAISFHFRSYKSVSNHVHYIIYMNPFHLTVPDISQMPLPTVAKKCDRFGGDCIGWVEDVGIVKKQNTNFITGRNKVQRTRRKIYSNLQSNFIVTTLNVKALIEKTKHCAMRKCKMHLIEDY